MKKPLFFILSILCSFIGVKGQIIKEQEFYDFYNSIIEEDTGRFILQKEVDFSRFPDLSSDTSWLRDEYGKDVFFSKADFEFMQKQVKEEGHFKWSSKKLTRTQTIDTATINVVFGDSGGGWTQFYKNYGHSFYSYSTPVFSLNKKQCIIYCAKYCGGLCGYGEVCVYKKVNNKWIVSKCYRVWVS